MANNGKSYSVQKELDKKYGVKSSSGRASGNTSVQDTLDQKYGYENSNQRRASVQDWSRRYGEVARAYGETGGTLTDESGDFRNRVNTLIQDYDKIKGYSGRMGLPNGQDYIRALRGMVDATGKNRQRAATASGLLKEDASALAGQKQKYERMLFELQKQRDTFLKDNPQTVASGAFAETQEITPMGNYGAIAGQDAVGYGTQPTAQQKQLDALMQSIRETQGTIGDINSRLNIYNRVDRFHDDTTVRYANAKGAKNARNTYRANRGQAEQNVADLRTEAERQAGLDRDSDAATDAWDKAYSAQDGLLLLDRFETFLERLEELSPEDREKLTGTTKPATKAERDRMVSITDGLPDYAKNWVHMTDEEQRAVFQIANTEGTTAAAQYLNDLQLTLDRRNTLQKEAMYYQDGADMNALGKILAGAASSPLAVIGGPVAFAGDVWDRIQGRDPNPYSNARLMQNAGTAFRSGAANDIYRDIAGDGSNPVMKTLGQLASNAYQSALSSVDSLLGMATMGKFYTISMGMSSAASNMRELYEAGASDDEIIIGSILSGIAEAFFEYVSLDKFADQWIEANPAKFIRKALIQAGVEGSEEVFTELADLMIDSINRGVNSDHEKRIRELMSNKDNPMSREDASQQATFDDVIDVMWAGLGGAFSGGLMSVGGLAYDLPRAYEGGVQIAENGSPSEVVNTALELRNDDKTAQRLQEQLNTTGNGEFGSRKSDYRQLYRVSLQNTADMIGKDVSSIRGGIETRMQEMNVPNGGKTVASAIVNRLTGKSLSASERLALAKNREAAQTVMEEIYSAAEGRTTAENAWVRNIGTFRIAPGAFGKAETQTEKAAREAMDSSLEAGFGDKAAEIATLYDEGQNRDAFVKEMLKVYHAGQEGTAMDSIPEGVTNASQRVVAYAMGAESTGSMESYAHEEGQSHLKSDSSPVNVVGFTSVGGDATLSLDDGGTAKASDVVFGTLGEARLYKVVADMGIGTEMANGLLKAAQNSRMRESAYAVSLHEAYQQGASGVAFDGIPSSNESMRIDESSRRTAWEAGRNAALQRDAEKAARVDGSKHGTKDGGLTVEESAKAIKSRNAQQESAMAAAEVLSRMGLNITVFASTAEERSAGMENGAIRLSDGSIRVDLNAGADGQGIMAYALSHEFTHFVEEMSAKKFRTFTDVLFAEVGKTGEDVKSLIDGKMAALKAQNEGLSESELRSLAYSEVVAEMMETAMTDTDVLARISAKLKQQDKTLWGRIKDFLKGLVEKLKNAYKGLNPDSAIARLAKETVTHSEAVLEAFSDAAADAVMNYQLQDGQKKNAREGGRYSLRGYTEQQKKNWENSKRIVIYDNQQQLSQFISDSIKDKTMDKKMYFGSVSSELAARIKTDTGVDVENYNLSLGSYEVRKILKDHGNDAKEAARGQRAVVPDDFGHITDVILNPTSIALSGQNYMGKPAIIFSGENNGRMNVVAVVSDKRLDLFVQTVYTNVKKGNPATPIGEQAPINTPEANSSMVSNSRITQSDANVKENFLKSSRQTQEVRDALREYRRQRDEEFKTMKAEYESQLRQVEESYRRQISQLEGEYSDTMEQVNEAFIQTVEAYEKSQFRNEHLTKTLAETLADAAKEKAKSEEDLAIMDREFRRLLSRYETSGRSIERLKASLAKARENAANKVDSARRTELRGKTFRAMNTLNRMLLNPSKTLYVPDSLQSAVIQFMQGLTGEIQRDPKGTLQLRGNLESIQAAYAKLAGQNEGVISSEVNEQVSAMLTEALDAIGDEAFNKLSREQLSTVYNAVKGVLTTIRNANKLHAANLRGTYGELSEQTYREFSMQKSREKVTGAARAQAEALSWNMEKPVYAAMRLGSGTMLNLYQNLRDGEDTWARDFREAQAYAVGTMEKYRYDDFTDGIVNLTDRNGQTVGLNLEERMSLYAYARREQAVQHLTAGGFVLSSRETRSVKNRLGIKSEQRVSDFSTYVLTEEQAAAIRGENLLKLTENQMAFADAMQDYLSTVCGEKNNEISRELYGVSLAKEKNYWPIRSSGMFSEIVRNRQENPGNRQKNAGHMKATNAHARNAMELSGFMDTWASAVDATNMYHAFTLPMEDFMKVWNWKDTERNVSMRQIVLEKHGEAAVQYFDTFMKDLNRGVRTDPRASAMNRMLSTFKKGAVSFSLSVAIQQPSAVGRAFAFISPRYFVGAKVESVKGINETWETMQKYAPVVTLKDVGRFDMDMGRSTTDILTGKGEKGVMGFIDKAGGALPEFMDKVTWIAMWEAAKRQVQAENRNLNGEALLQKAGELFTKTITETQVYDSVFSRNGLMRSQDVMAKAATAFMAEPATTANMVMKAMRDAQNRNFRSAGRVLASVGVATLLNSLLASLVYASRDDDEDMPWIERYLKSFANEMIDGVNPLGYIPVVKDLWSIFQGYDVTRSDVSQWADLYKATTKFVKAWEKYGDTDKEDMEARREALKAGGKASADVTAAVLNLFGIPLRNVLRDVRGIGNVVREVMNPREGDRQTRGYALWNGLNDYMPTILRADTSKSREVYRAVASGSEAWVNRVKSGYDDDEKFEAAVVKSLWENDGRITEAAKASASGDEDARKRLTEEIVSEGKFTQKQVEEAIEKQIKKLPGATYDTLLDAVKNGGDVEGEIASLERYGYSKSQCRNRIQSAVKEWYQDGAVSKQEAQRMLDAYAGATPRSAETIVKKWSSKVTVGIDFEDIQDEYVAGNMTGSRAVEMYMRYGGYNEKDAKEIVRQWGAEKDLGIKYNDLRTAFVDGEISESTLRSALIKYGGKEQSEADALIQAYRYQKRNPNTELSIAEIKSYIKEIPNIGKSISELGIPESVYLQYRKAAAACEGTDKNGDGKTDSGSKKAQILEEIDRLPISRQQKDGLYYANGWSSREIRKAPWN